MKQNVLSFFLLCMLFVGAAYGQERTIRGKVVDKEGSEPLPGVSIIATGTNTGTQTDTDGQFSLTLPQSTASITISYIGYENQTITLSSSNEYNIELSSDAAQLSEVVVTALGIKRERQALGYATQEVKGENLTVNNNQNVLNNLSGRVAGAQVTASSGAVGASSRIVLRGNNSFGGNNQPLFVIDGVPIDNSATNVNAGGRDGVDVQNVDFGSGIQELDPNNIESVNVLKGANAAALYGSRAANGVIVITTKSGSGEKGLGITYSGGASFEKPYIFPRFQNKYGQGRTGGEYWYQLDGSPGSYNDWARENSFSYVDGFGGGVNDEVDESWGPRLDAGLLIPQFNSPLDADGNRTATPWVSHPDNFRSYFDTGYTLDNNLAFTSNTDKGSTRFAVGNQTQKGTIPNTDQKRNTVQLRTTQNITDRFTVEALVNYVRTDNDNLIGQGYNSFNPLNSIGSWFGRQVDMEDLRRNQGRTFEDGRPYNWISIYHDNPFEVANSIFQQARTKDRMFGYMSASYKFSDWLNAMVRVGDDWSYENRQQRTSDRQIDVYRSGMNGNYRQTEFYKNELNVDFLLTGSGSLSDDFSLNYTAGSTIRDNKTKYTMIFAEDLAVPGVYSIENVNGYPQAENALFHRRVNSVYGQASVGYKSQLYLDLTARNDWSSTLPSGNWSYFYPSASLSWIFTESLGLNNSWLNYGKLRGSYAQVGNDTDPYQTFLYYLYVNPAFGGAPLNRLDSQIPPVNLKPEKVNSYEIGLELAAFNRRLRFDATYYDKITTNQIMGIDLPRFTGASSLLINAGEIQNKGVEIQLGGTPVQKGENGFNWDVDINWSLNRNRVNELYTDPTTGQELSNYPITNAWGVNISAVPGEEFGVIRGLAYSRNEEGSIIVNENGLPEFEAQQPIGNITPDWVGGINNSFSYKNFLLSFLVDFRKGGDFFSVTQMFGATTGVLDFTADGNIRETGVIAGENVMQDHNFVKADGSRNDIRLSADDFYSNVSYAGGGTEFDIIDGSFVKLRNITLGYRLPSRLVSKLGWMKGASLSLFANNVALLYTHKSNISNVDPETGLGVGNDGLGIEQYQIPSNRSIGLKLNLAL